ncbi:helix-turn-helix transcriptional regulator [Photobacterium satsumensis]|uniref:helix-turn-helix transcriptional regulator n=1 Tax=Photobacterium satsumensis TaxID=2910239 RepID=UPI003D0C9032
MDMKTAQGASELTEDELLIMSWEPAVDAIASLFGSSCEVVLHSFNNLQSSVTKIANGHVTGRQAGAPVTDFALQKLTAKCGSKWSTYFTRTKDGQMMKSASTTICNREGKPIGMLCVNFSLNAPIASLLEAFTLPVIANDKNEPIYSETFATSVDDLISQIITQVNNDSTLASNLKNKEIICQLYDRGIFELKESPTLVADKLGISKHTVYLHIRNHKQ